MSIAAKRLNLSTDLRDIIRRKVANGELTAGGRINEVRLSESLDVSRTPVREALSQLTAQGLIECKPRRGFFAKPLTAQEAQQLYPIRAILDPQALRLAGVPGKRELAALRAINHQLADATGKPANAIELDNRWHRRLLAGCPNRILLDLIDQFIWKTQRYEYAYMSQLENLQVATDEHDAILDALEQADLTGACRLLKRNMSSAEPALIAWLTSMEEKR